LPGGLFNSRTISVARNQRLTQPKIDAGLDRVNIRSSAVAIAREKVFHD
jgi:hypothetical protein